MSTLKYTMIQMLSFGFMLALFSIPFVANAAAVGSAFTYQGQLNFGGAPVSDPRDMAFGLYGEDDQIGTTVTLSNVPVNDGLFSVALDFGPDAFGNEQRWLQIDIKTPEAGEYTSLSPRMPIRPAPVALSVVDNSVGTAALKQGSVTRDRLAPDMETYIVTSSPFLQFVPGLGTIRFEHVYLNKGFDNYANDGVFVIPETGVYEVSYRLSAASGNFSVAITSSLKGHIATILIGEDAGLSVAGAELFFLEAGETISMQNPHSEAIAVLGVGLAERLTTFSIRRVD